MNFFSAYFDTEDNLVVSKKKIAVNYLSGWFWIDFLTDLLTKSVGNLRGEPQPLSN